MQNPIPELTSQIEKVTVYSDRAMISRRCKVTLEQGRQTVKLIGIPEGIQQDSLRVKAFSQTPGIKLMDVKTEIENHANFPSENVAYLADLVQKAEGALKRVVDRLTVIEKQREFLDGIQAQAADNASKDLNTQRPGVDELGKMVDFLGDRFIKLDEASYDLYIEKREKEAEVQKLRKDLLQLSGAAKKTRKVGLIDLDLTTGAEVELVATYVIFQVRWHPFYDARVDSAKKKINLQYYGVVTQTTGENWENIELRLSTSRPQLGGSVPELSPWYLQEMQYPGAVAGGITRSAPKGAMKKKARASASLEAGFMDEEEIYEAPMVETASTTVESSAGGSSVVFLVPGESDVPGNGGEARMLIMEEEFDAEFHYITVPRKEELVYLEAEFTNETEFPLLPGKINVFKDDEFVGDAQIPELKLPGESFDLQLGVDEGIRVKYKPKRAKAKEKGLFSKSRHYSYEQLITIENLRKTEEVIIVREIRPVSVEEDIKVSVQLTEPAVNPEMDKEKLPEGTVEWKLTVPAGNTAKCKLNFTVEFPKDMEVTPL